MCAFMNGNLSNARMRVLLQRNPYCVGLLRSTSALRPCIAETKRVLGRIVPAETFLSSAARMCGFVSGTYRNPLGSSAYEHPRQICTNTFTTGMTGVCALISSVRHRDHDYEFRLPVKGSRTPNQFRGVLLHTIACSGLSCVSVWAWRSVFITPYRVKYRGPCAVNGSNG
jgi:hypothetical protein